MFEPRRYDYSGWRKSERINKRRLGSARQGHFVWRQSRLITAKKKNEKGQATRLKQSPI